MRRVSLGQKQIDSARPEVVGHRSINESPKILLNKGGSRSRQQAGNQISFVDPLIQKEPLMSQGGSSTQFSKNPFLTHQSFYGKQPAPVNHFNFALPDKKEQRGNKANRPQTAVVSRAFHRRGISSKGGVSIKDLMSQHPI